MIREEAAPGTDCHQPVLIIADDMIDGPVALERSDICFGFDIIDTDTVIISLHHYMAPVIGEGNI